MAIGNAPWPLGVTNVGIHQRTGREKIFAKYVARILDKASCIVIGTSLTGYCRCAE